MKTKFSLKWTCPFPANKSMQQATLPDGRIVKAWGDADSGYNWSCGDACKYGCGGSMTSAKRQAEKTLLGV